MSETQDMLGEKERYWSNIQPFLMFRGYGLRRRYQPSWKPPRKSDPWNETTLGIVSASHHDFVFANINFSNTNPFWMPSEFRTSGQWFSNELRAKMQSSLPIPRFCHSQNQTNMPCRFAMSSSYQTQMKLLLSPCLSFALFTHPLSEICMKYSTVFFNWLR
jgi:hypothetical protein